MFVVLILFFVFSDYFLIIATDCNKSYIGQLHKGIIRSYNYPFNYQNNLNCTYSIYLPESNLTKNKKICFQTKSFFLEDSSPFCSFDYLKIGFPGASYKYCGKGVWQYGLYDPKNDYSSVWSPNLCWPINNLSMMDVTFVSDNVTVGKGFYIEYLLVDINQSYPRIDNEAPCGDGQWTCFNRQCILSNEVCDGLLDCSDGSDETYIYARCFEVKSIFACNISHDALITDTYCGLTFKGFTLEDDNEKQEKPLNLKTTVLLSSISGYNISLHKKQYCFSVWYSLYGVHDNSTIIIQFSQVSKTPEWIKQFKTQNENDSLEWKNLQLNVENIENFELMIQFQTREESHFGVKDISLTEGLCSNGELSCNFATSLCGWTNIDLTNLYPLPTAVLNQWNFLRVPDSNQGFAQLDLSNSQALGFLMNPSFVGPSENQKISMQYYVRSLKESDLCYVSIFILSTNASLSEVWNGKEKQMNDWQIVQTDYVTNKPHQIVIIGYGESCFIFLRNVALQSEFLNDIPSRIPITLTHSKVTNKNLFTSPIPTTLCDDCEDNSCMAETFLCNGVIDCLDGKDEAHCDEGTTNSSFSSTPVSGTVEILGIGEIIGIVLGCIIVVIIIITAVVLTKIRSTKNDQSNARRSDSITSIIGKNKTKPRLPSATDLQGNANIIFTHSIENGVPSRGLDGNLSMMESESDVLEFPPVSNQFRTHQIKHYVKPVDHVYEEPQYPSSLQGLDEASPSSSFSYIQRPVTNINEDSISLELRSPVDIGGISSTPVHWKPQIQFASPFFITSANTSNAVDNSFQQERPANVTPKKKVSIDPRNYLLGSNYNVKRTADNFQNQDILSMHATNV